MNQSVTCPNCGTNFNAEEVISQKLEADLKQKFQEQLRENNEVLNKQKAALKEEQTRLKEEQIRLQETKEKENEIFLKKVAAEKEKMAFELKKNAELEKEKLAFELKKKAEDELSSKMKVLQEDQQKKQEDIMKLKSKEIEMMQKIQAYGEKEAEMQLELQKQILLATQSKEEEIQKREAEKNELKFKEYQKQLDDQKKLIEEMKRKSEQGSMQLQGEVQELALEELLANSFPFDQIQEVGKGQRGADCVQIVRNEFGKESGKIIFESKRTKSFSQEWIDKLKADQRTEGAEIAVLVTQVLPKEMDQFGVHKGVWICNFTEVKSLIQALRDGLIKVNQALASQENKGDKMSMLYQFLTGPEFKGQIEAIVEGFTSMKTALDKEKRAMQKIWKEREKQIDKVVFNTIDMYGSVKGIAGSQIGAIEGLELDDGEDDEMDALED